MKGLVLVLAAAASIGVASSVDGRAVAIRGIHAYQHTLAPIADGVGARCRFTPSCSRYAEAVIARDGLVRGGIETMKRIARCGPWTPQGSRDQP